MKQRLKLWHAILLVVLLAPVSVWGANTMWSALSTLNESTIATGDFFPFIDISDTTHGTAGTAKTITLENLKDFIENQFIATAGSASANSWFKFVTGTLLTAAEEGAVEYVEPVQYFTPDNDGGRAIAENCHTIYLNADFTGTAGTGSQPIFPAATDRLTLKASTTYRFKLFMSVTNGATTATKALHFSGGTATFTAIRYLGIGQNVAVNTTGTAQSSTHVDTAASTVILATGTTSWWITADGGFTINASGTFLPQFAFSANPTGTVLIKRGSYMEICPIGATADVAVGSWQ